MSTSEASTSTTRVTRSRKGKVAGENKAEPLFTVEQADVVKRILKRSTYFEKLGILPDASIMEILTAARNLLQQVNPETNKAPGAAKAQITLRKAYTSCLRKAHLKENKYSRCVSFLHMDDKSPQNYVFNQINSLTAGIVQSVLRGEPHYFFH